MSNSILLVIIEIAKDVTYFDNEQHENMQSNCDGFMLSCYLTEKYNLSSKYWKRLCPLYASDQLILICYHIAQLSMKKILYRIKCDWEDLMKKPELVILKKYADISRLCTIVIAISFYLYSAFLIFPSFLSIFQYIFGFISESELILILPLSLHYFQTNLMHYYVGICIEYAIIVIVTTIGIANYSMFVASIQHACALFKIIDCRIPFYSISVKAQKMLLFLIMSSMRLCNLSMMGVKEISHDMFATVKDY
uniref:Uncharacterized protein n=1 Tax=Vespula pensylvanica TaxID=30213 RepID=A0A834JFU9_VESPE|nr:hypothetical protein H0235_018418 [Vespula pensylvanica]